MTCAAFYNDKGFSGFLYNGKAYYFDNNGVYQEKPIHLCYDTIVAGISNVVKCSIKSISHLSSYSKMNIKNFYFLEKLTDLSFNELFKNFSDLIRSFSFHNGFCFIKI